MVGEDEPVGDALATDASLLVAQSTRQASKVRQGPLRRDIHVARGDRAAVGRRGEAADAHEVHSVAVQSLQQSDRSNAGASGLLRLAQRRPELYGNAMNSNGLVDPLFRAGA